MQPHFPAPSFVWQFHFVGDAAMVHQRDLNNAIGYTRHSIFEYTKFIPIPINSHIPSKRNFMRFLLISSEF